ncbi:hypothetical protein [Methylomonas sp. CM2]|uniref:hypothetical protein n=1 Tax=Methylomonas sp. CM2 TaxID=3417647 RepID=UPI003CF1E2D4
MVWFLVLFCAWFALRWPVSGVVMWRLAWLAVGLVLLAVLAMALAGCWVIDRGLKPLADWIAEQAEVLE